MTFDQFRSWLLIHKDATVLSKWLLSDVNSVQDIETPTFYQSLAGVTHLEEKVSNLILNSKSEIFIKPHYGARFMEELGWFCP